MSGTPQMASLPLSRSYDFSVGGVVFADGPFTAQQFRHLGCVDGPAPARYDTVIFDALWYDEVALI